MQFCTLVLPVPSVVSLWAHDRHPVASAADWYSPTAQSVHAVSLCADVNVPVAHASQADPVKRVPG